MPAPEAERAADALFDLGATGIEERDGTTLVVADGGGVTLVASFEDDPAAEQAASALPARYRPRIEHVVGDAWRHAWKERFKPFRAGPRLIVTPSWEQARSGPGDAVLTIDPGNAFGSGTHESTRLALREIDRSVRGGETLLDVGCGSGILAIAALLLGAGRARAIDVDPDAVRSTRENARRNGVAARLTASTTALKNVRGRYDRVVANIQSDVLIANAKGLVARLAPHGLLILAGILLGQEEEVQAAFTSLRLRSPLVTRDGEWVAIVLRAGRT